MKSKIFAVLFSVLLLFPFLVNAKSLDDYHATTVTEALAEEGIAFDAKDFVTNDKQITIYLFRGSGCSHCHEFLEYVSKTLVKEYGKMFTIKSYETWGDATNAELMETVGAYMGYQPNELGVPFFIIGDKAFVGYASSMNEDIIAKIKSEYESSERVDKVVEALENAGNDSSSGVSSTSVIIWNLVFVIIATVVVLVYLNVKFTDLETLITTKKK